MFNKEPSLELFPMKTMKLGKTGLEVSRVGFGGIPIQRPSEDEAIRVLQRALDLGFNFIDTSVGYGTSESRIGEALEGKREEVILATKGGWRDKEIVRGSLAMSLKQLKTDYIDVWQFHNVSSLEAYHSLFRSNGPMEAALEALSEDTILHLGISSHSLEVVREAVVSDQFETIQFPFNFVYDDAAKELIPLAKEHEVGFIGMKPFAGGMIPKANLALKYILQFETVLPDPGIETIEQVEEIVGLLEAPLDISANEHAEMELIRTELGTKFCRQCGYCQPCPNGVSISLIMIAPIMWKLWPRESLTSSWYKNAIESGSRCVQCGECEDKCPYQLPIREMIRNNLVSYEEALST
jgi:predicted aldo/keto reductase-like oxidoreductase